MTFFLLQKTEDILKNVSLCFSHRKSKGSNIIGLNPIDLKKTETFSKYILESLIWYWVDFLFFLFFRYFQVICKQQITALLAFKYMSFINDRLLLWLWSIVQKLSALSFSGKYLDTKCNATSNPVCVTCPRHTFTDQENNMKECRVCRECTSSNFTFLYYFFPNK